MGSATNVAVVTATAMFYGRRIYFTVTGFFRQKIPSADYLRTYFAGRRYYTGSTGYWQFMVKPPVDKTLLVNMLGFLLGLHNSTSTQLSQGKVRTTHITGTLTDAGITLATLLLHRVLRYSAEERRHHQYLLSIYLTATGAFITGGIIGVLSFNLFSMQAFSLAGIVLVLVSGITIRRTLQQQRRIAGRISPVRVP